MKKHHDRKGDTNIRRLLTIEAAKLMYEEGVSQYHTAKHMAAKKLLINGQRLRQVRPNHLPSNDEISDAINTLADMHEGEARKDRLFEMRILALDVLNILDSYSPRLIGSVSTGNIKKSSDIDIHVFVDDNTRLTDDLEKIGWNYQCSEVAIRDQGKIEIYQHVHIDLDFPVELSVYPCAKIRVRTRSSTDGKPILRLSSDKLITLMMKDHPQEWQHYIETGNY